jgi:hypothetical protein
MGEMNSLPCRQPSADHGPSYFSAVLIKTALLVVHRTGGVVRIAEYDLGAFLAEHRGG